MQMIYVFRVKDDKLECEFIKEDDEDLYLANGWKLGRIRNKVRLSRLTYRDTIERITVKRDEVVNYVKKGWRIGKLTKDELLFEDDEF